MRRMTVEMNPEVPPAGSRKRAGVGARHLWVVGLAACNSGPGAPAPAPPGKSAPATVAPSAAALAEDTEASEATQVTPVYAAGPVALNPKAQQFCTALHEAPARQHAACCGRPAPTGGQTVAECARLLSLSLAQGAVALDDTALGRCVTALESPGRDCATMGRFTPPAPEACLSVVVGRLAAGAVCRSDLECDGSLQCRGSGPTEPGVCEGPRPLGAGCGTAADVLISFTRLSEAEKLHPECDGLCILHRCAPLTPLAGACTANLQCGPGRACIAGKCAEAPKALAPGAACPGFGCAAGTQCIGGSCQKPAPPGTRCETDFQCEGACLKKNILDKTGTCGMFCP